MKTEQGYLVRIDLDEPGNMPFFESEHSGADALAKARAEAVAYARCRGRTEIMVFHNRRIIGTEPIE